MDIFSFTVDLIDQREVEVETFDPLSVEHSHLGLVLLKLHVFDHIREPHAQSVVTESQQNKTLQRYTFKLFLKYLILASIKLSVGLQAQ